MHRFCAFPKAQHPQGNNIVIWGWLQHNNVFQQKQAFNVSVQGGLSILPCHLALSRIRTAPSGSGEYVRYIAFRSTKTQ